jgi:hypothetical protein
VNYNKSTHLNQPKYWEQPGKKNHEQKKKKVSFDDILSNMNLVVNQNGVLQSMVPLQQYDNEHQQYDNQYQQYDNQYQQYDNQYQHNYQVSKQKTNEPLSPVVKHSYIFNKYFKDYKDANNNTTSQPRVPKTVEEYKQMVLEEKIKQVQERIRISQIKSTKMMFTSNPNMQQNGRPGVILSSKNNLRSLRFN